MHVLFLLLMFLIGCGSDNPIAPMPEEPKSDHTTGDLVIDLPGGVKMAFVWIEPGTFMMGAVEGETSREQELPRHRVTITKGFYLGKYEVTQKQWLSLINDRPWEGITSSPVEGIGHDYPVVRMQRDDIATFMSSLNAHEQTEGMRLPTEAEWEYACRAGTETIWSFGNDVQLLDDYAWYSRNANSQAQAVGLKLPNPWGLYDMHGNISEWLLDGFRTYTLEPETDPIGPDPQRQPMRPDLHYVERGGSWLQPDTSTRSSVRYSLGVTGRHIGFRVLLEGPKR